MILYTTSIPEIIKGNAQVNFIEDNLINIMDLESYESLDVEWPTEEDLVSKLKELQVDPNKMSSSQIEFWQIAGKTLINRIFQN